MSAVEQMATKWSVEHQWVTSVQNEGARPVVRNFRASSQEEMEKMLQRGIQTDTGKIEWCFVLEEPLRGNCTNYTAFGKISSHGSP